jgi:hypothetical protein
MTKITEARATSLLRDTIQATEKVAIDWRETAQVVRKWYGGTYDQWMGEKSAILDGIMLKALPAERQLALTRIVPRKGTKDGNAWDKENGTAKRDQFAEEKKNALAYRHELWKRLTAYMYEAEIAEAKAKAKAKAKAEADDGDGDEDEIDSSKLATNKAKLMADLSNWVKRLQKSEGEDFDINATIGALQATLAVLSK